MKIKKYRTTVLSVVLYGCETWSLTLREVCRLRVFENRVLRGIFGPKRDEVTGEWRNLHLRSLMICTAHQIQVLLGDQIEKNKTDRAFGMYGGQKRCIQDFGGET